ncbi:MAG: transcriptional repressor [Chloroflexota bacterium]|nr:transcriptional repressor [Chloroflexota bacterium]
MSNDIRWAKKGGLGDGCVSGVYFAEVHGCHNMNHRRSKQRETILRILRSTKSHPTAEWIYDQTRMEMPSISLGTVYRNLKLLKDSGEILQLDITPSFSRYDGNPENHYHFRCEACDRVYDVDMPIISNIDDEVTQSTGFRVSHHILEFRGICQDCAQAKQVVEPCHPS